MFEIFYTNSAKRDYKKLSQSPLLETANELVEILRCNPFQEPPPYEALKGNLKGAYSRRLNRQHRLVYEVFEDEKAVKIIRMWSHYE